MQTMSTKEYRAKYGKLGDCSKVTFDIMANYQSKFPKDFNKLPEELQVMLGKCGEVKLANGLVWHSETKWHYHAWIEDDRYCFDFSNGMKGIVPKERYYKVGKIKDVHLYTRKEAMLKGVTTGVCGFWDMCQK